MPSVPSKGIVLFVEDEAPFRTIYRDVLRRYGYLMTEAEDGERGWTVLQEVHPVAILLDQVLPKLSGLDLLKRIRADRRFDSVPIIMFSVVTERKVMERCIKAGADDYAAKGSFMPLELITMVEAAIRKRSSGTQAMVPEVVRGKGGRPEVRHVPASARKRVAKRASRKKAKK